MFITLEGIEGCGKSTQQRLLAEWLTGRGLRVVTTREPGGSPLGVALRRILLSSATTSLTGRAELFLYLADRAQHVATVIRPALAAGEVVVSDRFADSTVAYQGHGRGLEVRLLQQLNAAAVDGTWPDLTLLLDLDPAVGLTRARQRNTQAAAATGEDEGRFEAESLAFHGRVRQGFLELAAAEPHRFVVIDASLPLEGVTAAIQAAVAQKLAASRPTR